MNLFELFVKIGVDDKASGAIKKITNGLGKGLKTAAKIGTAAVATATTGITALTTAAAKSYAEYEQLVGGAELMFGDAFQTVMNNAQDAYKTVQMSQNEYLQQVNGFATGLKTALGGNEQAAADLAHKIIQAEADIVAATGNTQENVQNAFNGIMKSNFTMLDNLQIGITPTKEGFQEVIDKVNDWNAAMGNATNYQMGNLADMQSALVDYIDMVGMSGYAQDEASRTISGSVSSMKAAWSDFLTSLADENSNYQYQLNNLIVSVKTVAKNVYPVVEQVLLSISDLVEDVLPKIATKIPEIISEVLPRVAEIAVKLIESLMNGISNSRENLFESIFSVVEYIGRSFLGMLPDIVYLGLKLVGSLAQGISSNLDKIIPAVLDVATKIIETLTSPETVDTFIRTGFQLLTSLVSSLPEIINFLVSSVSQILKSIVGAISPIEEELKKLFSEAWNSITEIFRPAHEFFYFVFALAKKSAVQAWSDIKDNFSGVYSNVKNAFSGIWSWFSTTFALAKKSAINAWSDIKDNFSRVYSNVKNAFSGIGTWFSDTFASAKKSAINAWSNIKSSFNSIWDNIKGVFSNAKSDFCNIGSNIVSGIKSGISNAWKNLKTWFQNLFGDLTGIAKKILGIASPSKVFKKLGFWTAEGFGIGFQDEFDHVKHDMEKTLTFDKYSVGINKSIKKIDLDKNGFGSKVGGVSIVQNIYSEAKTAADLMQEALYHQERAVLLGV